MVKITGLLAALVNPFLGVASKFSKAKLLRIFGFLFYVAFKSELLSHLKQKKPAFRLAFENYGGEGGIISTIKIVFDGRCLEPGFSSHTSFITLRRGRDSNPRYTFGVYTLSRRAPSATRTPLHCLKKLRCAKVRKISQHVFLFTYFCVC